MQTVEALISLLFFVSVFSFLFTIEEPNYIDDSLYRIQLAEDAWRVLYLRGNFEDLDRAKLLLVEEELIVLGEETRLCYFIDGIQITNCRGGSASHAKTVSLRKTVVHEGMLVNITFSIGT